MRSTPTSNVSLPRQYGDGVVKAKHFIGGMLGIGDENVDKVFEAVAFSDDPLDTFPEMWYQVFLWAFFSSIFVHTIAAIVALCNLRRHKIGRWVPVAILIMGIIGPLTGGAITSAVIAWSYHNSSEQMPPLYALVAGLIQTIILVVISFTKVMATL